MSCNGRRGEPESEHGPFAILQTISLSLGMVSFFEKKMGGERERRYGHEDEGQEEIGVDHRKEIVS